MSLATRRTGPSTAFVGVLVGIVASFIVPPRMMLSRSGVVLWLLAWAAVGRMVGLAVDFLTARGRPPIV